MLAAVPTAGAKRKKVSEVKERMERTKSAKTQPAIATLLRLVVPWIWRKSGVRRRTQSRP